MVNGGYRMLLLSGGTENRENSFLATVLSSETFRDAS